MVGEHDAARADAEGAGGGGDMGDHQRGGGGSDAGHVVMFGQPEAGVAVAFGGLGEGGGVLNRVAGGAAFGDWGEVKDRVFHGAPPVAGTLAPCGGGV